MAAVKKEKLSTIISFLGQSGSGENLSLRITLFTPVDKNQIKKFAFNWVGSYGLKWRDFLVGPLKVSM